MSITYFRKGNTQQNWQTLFWFRQTLSDSFFCLWNSLQKGWRRTPSAWSNDTSEHTQHPALHHQAERTEDGTEQRNSKMSLNVWHQKERCAHWRKEGDRAAGRAHSHRSVWESPNIKTDNANSSLARIRIHRPILLQINEQTNKQGRRGSYIVAANN